MKKVLATVVALTAIFFSSCQKSELKITSIIYDDNLEYFREAISGMKDAASLYKVSFENFNTWYDLDSEYGLTMASAVNGTNAVVFCPIDYSKSSDIVRDIQKKGIPVVTWNTVTEEPVTSKIIVDSYALGADTGNYISEYFKEHNLSGIKTAMITNSIYTVAKERCEGFAKSIEPLVQSGKILLSKDIPCELMEETKSRVKYLIESAPDTQLIWCWNQTTLIASLETLKQLNRTDILLCGTDMSLSLAAEMLDPDSNLIAVTTQQPYLMGYTAVENAILAYCGKTPEAEVVIPVLTYTKDSVEELRKYLQTSKLNN